MPLSLSGFGLEADAAKILRVPIGTGPTFLGVSRIGGDRTNAQKREQTFIRSVEI